MHCAVFQMNDFRSKKLIFILFLDQIIDSLKYAAKVHNFLVIKGNKCNIYFEKMLFSIFMQNIAEPYSYKCTTIVFLFIFGFHKYTNIFASINF